VGPAHGRTRGYLPYDAAKTKQPAIELRRHPDLFAEQLAEPAAAETRARAHIDDRPHVRRVTERPQSVSDGRMQTTPPSSGPLHRVTERAFEDFESLRRRARVAQPIAQAACPHAPHVAERNDLIVEIAGGRVEERARAAGSENDSHHRGDRAGV